MSFEIVADDLSDERSRALVVLHLSGMHGASPPGSVHALNLSALRAPSVSLWTVREGNTVLSIGALKRLDASAGEVKSMRTHPDHVRRGAAALLLDHIIRVARERGMTSLHLETGSGAAFEPALALYRSRGFVSGAAFADYVESPFNQFFHLRLG